MATELEVTRERFAREASSRQEYDEAAAWEPVFRLWEVVKLVLGPFASLRVTVVLFLLAIFLIYVGTLAQVDLDINDVLHKYFRSAYVWIPFQVLFPRSFFPALDGKIGGTFLFPGGATIGGAMIVNLLAAHLVRFQIQSRGTRLLAGLGVLGLGVVALMLAIASGFSTQGILESSLIPWPVLWRLFIGSLVLVTVLMAYGWLQYDSQRKWERILLGGATVIVGALTAWLVWRGDSARLDDSGMRILWQLLKGQAVATILYVACHLLFKKRAGIVLLHGGIALMMISEVVVSFWAVEGQMMMREGETLSYVNDIRTVELAVIDRSNPHRDTVVSIPKSFLKGKLRRISDARLPFDIEVVKFMENSRLEKPKAGGGNLATAGFGTSMIARPARTISGTDTNKGVNLPSAYIKLFDKRTKRELGTHLVSLFFSVGDKTVVDGKQYELELRHQRTYKPYALKLLDVRKDDYVGTSTPKNYSSDVHLVDKSRGVDRPTVHIKMNEPLRFADETFYQSGYNVDRNGAEYTTLSVVSNFGWMIPYIACMIVGTGMFAQFIGTLGRFLDRMDRGAAGPALLEAVRQSIKRPADAARRRRERLEDDQPSSWLVRHERWFATGGVVLATLFVSYYAMKPLKPHAGMDLEAFGKLPVAHQGRVKPLDTVARNTLRILSQKLEYKDADGKKQPAIRWLADVLARPQEAMNYKVIRIDNLELLRTLGLERRKDHLYSIAEFQDKLPALEKQVAEARDSSPERLSTYQRKALELEKKLGEVITLRQAFAATVIRPEHTQEDVMAAMQRNEFLESGRVMPALAIPPADDKGKWTAYSTASFDMWRRDILRAHGGDEAMNSPLANAKVHPAVARWSQIFAAYAEGEASTFNREVAAYQAELAAAPPSQFSARRIGFESWFNRAELFYYTSIIYYFTFVMSLIGMFSMHSGLRGLRVFQTSATWLMAFSLVVHGIAVIARMYISQYAPVTNLYSSAVFIGLACVAIALVLESIFHIGLANMVGAVAGFLTLLVAHYLSLDGDTIGVMQAVLDTQFWLSTHVVTISLGYATTLLAGLLGIAYVIYGVFTPGLDRPLSKTLAGMIYSVICFAMFFSFVGTVLGGLWADDSWGRFWGWDPKENGALIIVLWNALVLHAKWGKMIGDRGLAVLAVMGNICTCWSWFGVNELGVGLHSYGFTEGVLMWLGIAIAAHLTIVAIGLMPLRHWMSARGLQGEEPVLATLA